MTRQANAWLVYSMCLRAVRSAAPADTSLMVGSVEGRWTAALYSRSSRVAKPRRRTSPFLPSAVLAAMATSTMVAAAYNGQCLIELANGVLALPLCAVLGSGSADEVQCSEESRASLLSCVVGGDEVVLTSGELFDKTQKVRRSRRWCLSSSRWLYSARLTSRKFEGFFRPSPHARDSGGDDNMLHVKKLTCDDDIDVESRIASCSRSLALSRG